MENTFSHKEYHLIFYYSVPDKNLKFSSFLFTCDCKIFPTKQNEFSHIEEDLLLKIVSVRVHLVKSEFLDLL